MTTDDRGEIARLFAAASELPMGEREALLNARAERDPDVVREVRSLLAHDSHTESDGFLDSPIKRNTRITSDLPDTIGRYRIVGVLGEGGMGTVYEAEQDSPRRSVALKVLRSEFATEATLRRFTHESEILGRLDHPGIAHVYEADVETTGGDNGSPIRHRPYFAMELIRGERIDDYVRSRDLSIRDRVKLIARICDALHHAHQKGVVHRDIKPANILIGSDGSPRIVDFGVARVTSTDLQITTMATRANQLVGTLSYMSPEQVAGDPNAVDVRSDVYAIGVVAYEILTSQLPLILRDLGIAEAARVIRDDEPTRLQTHGADYRGDVDTIVMKALEKDPERRYASASEFAADIRRWLDDDPILARPPSALYQFQCFARRNRGVVVAASLAAIALVGGLIASTTFAIQASRAEVRAKEGERDARADATRAVAVSAFLERLLSVSNPFGDEPVDAETPIGDVLTTADTWIEGEFEGQPLGEAAARTAIGRTLMGLGKYDAALVHLDAAIASIGDTEADLDDRDTGPILLTAYRVRSNLRARRDEAALAIADADAVERLLDAGVPLRSNDERITVFGDLGFVYKQLERPEPAVRWLRRALEECNDRDELDAKFLRNRGAMHNNLAGALVKLDQLDEAGKHYALAYDDFNASYDEQASAEVGVLANNIGTFHLKQKNFEEAITWIGRAATMLEEVVGDHPVVADTLNNLAWAHETVDQPDEARKHYVLSLAMTERTNGRNTRDYAVTNINFGWMLETNGFHDEAAERYRESARIYRALPDDDRHLHSFYYDFCAHRALSKKDGYAPHRDVMHQEFGSLRDALGDDHEIVGRAFGHFLTAAETASHTDDVAWLTSLPMAPDQEPAGPSE